MPALSLPHALPAPVPLRPPSPTLARCLVLAVLLHLWAVLMFGSAPGGSARPGEGVWGAVNITLRGPEKAGATVPPPPAPEATNGPTGTAPQPRFGGAVREAAPMPDADPGAAQLGRWAAQPAPAPAPVAPLAPTPPMQPLPLPAAVPALPPTPPGRVVEETANPPSPAPVLPPSPAAAPPAPAAVAPPPPPAAPAPAPLPAPLPEPVLRRMDATPAAPALPQPSALPLAPTPALPPLATTPLPSPAPAPLPTPPLVAPAVAAPVPAPATPGPVAPAAIAAPGAAPGLPDAGSRVGADVATPPAAAASAPPRLKLELARPRGGELSRGGSRGVLPVLPRPPELPDKLARDIEKAAKEDCRKAHAGAGILAPIPLIVDALRKDGCKW